jgi:hypothetical protein
MGRGTGFADAVRQTVAMAKARHRRRIIQFP